LDNHNQKISHLKALFHLAAVDKVLSKVEIVYIRIVAERLGVDPGELLSFDGTEPKLVLPDREYKIYALFHRLAIIIMLDDKMDEKERIYCFNLGVKMGLHPNAIGEIIDYIGEHGAMDSDANAVIAIFKKYAN
jgi:hypothetical protein